MPSSDADCQRLDRRSSGVLTLTPYDSWRRAHAIHHASSGKSRSTRYRRHDTTLTVAEYLARPSPATSGLPTLPPSHRAVRPWPGVSCFSFRTGFRLGEPCWNWRSWLQPNGDQRRHRFDRNACDLVRGHRGRSCSSNLPVILLASPSMGVWLFFVQHQFEDTFWAKSDAWAVHEAALHGSSHYDLPPVLRWFTANIGVHHVHHLCSRIP